MNVVLLGASGTIGRATARALAAAGHQVRAVLRPGTGADLPEGTRIYRADVTRPGALAAAMAGADAAICCLASRTGTPADARAIDRDATIAAVEAAEAAGLSRFVLLSAICVEPPRLAFQHAKRAAEDRLMASPMGWTVVRPTAFFKSLSGQVARVAAGRAFLVFGDGRLTACAPISDADLADFLVARLSDPAARGRILPVGGPGPAITPRDQAAILSNLLGRPVPVRRVPLALLDAAAASLGAAARLRPALGAKAELARIGRFYATTSMLARDPATGRPDADSTPRHGRDTLRAHYARLLAGEATDDRGAHAVF